MVRCRAKLVCVAVSAIHAIGGARVAAGSTRTLVHLTRSRCTACAPKIEAMKTAAKICLVDGHALACAPSPDHIPPADSGSYFAC